MEPHAHDKQGYYVELKTILGFQYFPGLYKCMYKKRKLSTIYFEFSDEILSVFFFLHGLILILHFFIFVAPISIYGYRVKRKIV